MAGTYEPISSTTLSTAQASIVFSNIPQTYTDLFLSIIGRSTTTNDPPNVFMRLNGDTTTTPYSSIRLRVDNSDYATNLSTTSITVGNVPSNKTAAGPFGLININIMNYSSTVTKTTILSEYNSAVLDYGISVGLFNLTSAVTSVTILPTSGNWTSGTTATIFGILKA